MNTIHDTGFGDSELAQKARAFYEQHVAPKLTEADFGKYLIIDTDTENYVLDSDDYQAAVRAVQQNPGGRNRFCVRIGHRTASNSYRRTSSGTTT